MEIPWKTRDVQINPCSCRDLSICMVIASQFPLLSQQLSLLLLIMTCLSQFDVLSDFFKDLKHRVKTSLTKKKHVLTWQGTTKPSLYGSGKEKRKTGGVSYRAYAQMLSQTILGTECSLSHFQKTSYLPWQQQSGKRQKKERGDKEKMLRIMP